MKLDTNLNKKENIDLLKSCLNYYMITDWINNNIENDIDELIKIFYEEEVD